MEWRFLLLLPFLASVIVGEGMVPDGRITASSPAGVSVSAASSPSSSSSQSSFTDALDAETSSRLSNVYRSSSASSSERLSLCYPQIFSGSGKHAQYSVGLVVTSQVLSFQADTALAACLAVEDLAEIWSQRPLSMLPFASGWLVGIELGIYDSRTSEAVRVATKLVNDGAIALIGPPYSADTQAVQRALPISVPQLSFSSSNSQLSDKDLYPSFVRFAASDDVRAAALVALLRNRGVSDVATLTIRDEFGLYGNTDFIRHAQLSGITITRQEYYQPGQIGANDTGVLDPVMAALSASGSKTFVLFCLTGNCAMLLDIAMKHGLLKPPNMWLMAGADAIWTKGVIESMYPNLFWELVQYNPVLSVMMAPEQGVLYPSFARRIQMVTGVPPTMYSSMTYDSIIAIGLAIIKLLKNDITWDTTRDPKALLQTIITNRFQGATGNVSLDSNGDRPIPFDFFMLRNASTPIVAAHWDPAHGISVYSNLVFFRKQDSQCGNNVVDYSEECDGGEGCSECTCTEGYVATTGAIRGCKLKGKPDDHLTAIVTASIGAFVLALALVAAAIATRRLLRRRKRSKEQASYSATATTATATATNTIGPSIDVPPPPQSPPPQLLGFGNTPVGLIATGTGASINIVADASETWGTTSIPLDTFTMTEEPPELPSEPPPSALTEFFVAPPVNPRPSPVSPLTSATTTVTTTTGTLPTTGQNGTPMEIAMDEMIPPPLQL